MTRLSHAFFGGRRPHAAVRLFSASAADAETLDQRLVSRFVVLLHVIEQGATLRDHFEQAAARMVVLDMGFEMASQVGDPLGEDGHLNLRRTRIAGLQCIVFDERGLALGGDRHRYVLNVAASRTRLLGAAEPGCRPGRSMRPGGTRTGGLYRIRRAAPEGLWPRVPLPLSRERARVRVRAASQNLKGL